MRFRCDKILKGANGRVREYIISSEDNRSVQLSSEVVKSEIMSGRLEVEGLCVSNNRLVYTGSNEEQITGLLSEDSLKGYELTVDVIHRFMSRYKGSENKVKKLRLVKVTENIGDIVEEERRKELKALMLGVDLDTELLGEDVLLEKIDDTLTVSVLKDNVYMSTLENLCSYYMLNELEIRDIDTSRVRSIDCMACSRCLTKITLKNLDFRSVKSASKVFKESSSLKCLDIENCELSNVENISGMYDACGLDEIDLSWITSKKIKNMSSLFRNCYNLRSLNLEALNTDKVTAMGCLLYGCIKLDLGTLDFSNFDTSNVKNMEYMLAYSNFDITDISMLNTTNVTNMRGLFSECKFGKGVDFSKFDTSSVESMDYMFHRAKADELNISNFNAINVTSINTMFESAIINKLDMSNWKLFNLTDMSNLFLSADIQEIKMFDYSNLELTNVCCAFAGLNTSSLSLNGFDFSHANEMNNLFYKSKIGEVDLRGVKWINKEEVVILRKSWREGLDSIQVGGSGATKQIRCKNIKTQELYGIDASVFDCCGNIRFRVDRDDELTRLMIKIRRVR